MPFWLKSINAVRFWCFFFSHFLCNLSFKICVGSLSLSSVEKPSVVLDSFLSVICYRLISLMWNAWDQEVFWILDFFRFWNIYFILTGSAPQIWKSEILKCSSERFLKVLSWHSKSLGFWSILDTQFGNVQPIDPISQFLSVLPPWLSYFYLASFLPLLT